MKRRIVWRGGALALLSVLSGLVGTSLASAQTPHVSVKGLCTPQTRSFNVTATMHPVRGTVSMNVEFLLQAQTIGTRLFEPDPTAGLGRWLAPTNSSTLGDNPRAVWQVNQPVTNLARGYVYRVNARFRWLGSGGQVLATTHALSSVCRIPRYA